MGKTLAFISAAAVGLAPLAAARTDPAAVQAWARLRSVSEALKSELYIYLARTGTYRTANPDLELLARTQRIVTDAADLTVHIADLAPVQ
ncbi:DUF4231 domain-containing protein [Kutzneria sp. CA-103260]|uniref:DUF4231 domain-containing protein n=1 Tax=Kutzneria sp. CA-103260 TaxID=2802641 RepID=UPI001BADE25F|nr:DUF4231 domain-containing protein [Kutzneria sp. CA-103260]